MSKFLFFVFFSLLFQVTWVYPELSGASNPTLITAASIDSSRGPYALPHLIQEVQTSQSRKGVNVSLIFWSSVPEYKISKSSSNGLSLLTLNLVGTQMKNSEVPEINIPLSHMEIRSSVLSGAPQVQIRFYFPEIPVYSINKTANNLNISFSSKVEDKSLNPSVLNTADYRDLDDTLFLMKFEFDNIPKKRAVFLTGDSNSFVVNFYNTRILKPVTKPPEILNLKEFKYVYDTTNGGTPYLKLFYSFERKIEVLIREDPTRFFLDVIQREVLKNPEVVLPPIPPSPAAKSGLADSSPPASKTEPVKKKEKSLVKWGYIALTSAVILGSAATVYLVLMNKTENGEDKNTADKKVNGIETEVELPDPPE